MAVPAVILGFPSGNQPPRNCRKGKTSLGSIREGTGSSEEGETSQYTGRLSQGSFSMYWSSSSWCQHSLGLRPLHPHPYSHPQAHLEQG